MAMEKFKASPLPSPPPEYDPQYIKQLIRVIENYFSLLDSKTPMQNESYRALNFYGGVFHGDVDAGTVTADTVNADEYIGGNANFDDVSLNRLNSYEGYISALLANRIVARDICAPDIYSNNFYGSGRYINIPYNQFTSMVDQTAPDVATANSLELENTNFAGEIYIAGANDTDITFTQPGVYSVTYSLQFKNTTNDGQSIDIWISYNGTDYDNSNSKFFIGPRKANNDPSHLIAVTTITGQAFAASDYINIKWRVSDVAVTLEHLAAVTASAGVTPDIPATPSAIVQVNFISAAYPPVKYVAPLPVFGFGEVGDVTVITD
jgi:hypothetical protein